jgi:type I restriction enzyme R subunit
MTHDNESGSRRSQNHRPLEADWELLALDELAELAWLPASGNEFAPGSGHRKSWDDLILYPDLREAIERLNPELPPDAVRDAIAAAATPESQDTYEENRTAHGYLTTGIRSVVYTDAFGAEHNPTVRLVDLTDPDGNTYRALNQVTGVVEKLLRRVGSIVCCRCVHDVTGEFAGVDESDGERVAVVAVLL